jgi:hypothetical protein
METSASRPGGWLWLGTLSLAVLCFFLLVAHPVDARQEVPVASSSAPRPT